VRRSLEAIDALIRASEETGVPVRLLRAAARAVVDLEDELTATTDPRKVSTLEKARAALQARESGATRQQLIARFGIGKSTYDRWLRLARTTRASSSVNSSSD
jgi:uncharacterized heparinase superfamily protein